MFFTHTYSLTDITTQHLVKDSILQPDKNVCVLMYAFMHVHSCMFVSIWILYIQSDCEVFGTCLS